MPTFSAQEFQDLLATITDFISSQPLDKKLEELLNKQFPAQGKTVKAIEAACHQGIETGELCKYEGGGLKYGRIIKPTPALQGCSIDVVDMDTLAGPHHKHPQGEIDLIIPVDKNAKFDEHGAGWLVYPPNSAHSPTVTGGRAIILYLLPNGEIEFTGS